MSRYLDKGKRMNLPHVRAAFTNAKERPSSKEKQRYLHPIVYYAGSNTGWGLLKESMDSETYPLFKAHYESLCERVRSGEHFCMPHESPVTSPEQKHLNCENLKNMHGLYGE